MSGGSVVLQFLNRFDRCIYVKLPESLPPGVMWHGGMVYSGPEFGYPVKVETVVYKPNGQIIVRLENVQDEHSSRPDSVEHYRKHGWLPEARFDVKFWEAARAARKAMVDAYREAVPEESQE